MGLYFSLDLFFVNMLYCNSDEDKGLFFYAQFYWKMIGHINGTDEDVSAETSMKTVEVEIVRVKITLACTECKQRNYNTTKEKKNHPERMETRKYCKFCRKHTLHKETK